MKSDRLRPGDTYVRCACAGYIYAEDGPTAVSRGRNVDDAVQKHQQTPIHTAWDAAAWAERISTSVEVPVVVRRVA